MIIAGTGSGRPRDPDLDRRIADAAVEIFGQEGWSSFSVEAVARRAGVGKASVYRRWSSKEALLAEALATRLDVITDVDTGSVRGDLVQLVRQLLELYGGEHGRAALRLGIEAELIPGLAQRYAEVTRDQIRAVRTIVRRGIERGELPKQTSATHLLDVLCGGSMNHAMATRLTPSDVLRPRPGRECPYAERFVEFVLASLLVEEGPA
ncbi:TetR/AcrR family transcriptional regulator [Streptomyces sp. NPDC101151]|uniref:TetR/AcrR family transcriptional regulator n=1 Tax=Streptomyces sp. NPDC101151 TaxID=3366115 RepID=UPI0038287222